MTYYYLNPERESDAYSLPDFEVFECTSSEAPELADADVWWEAGRLFPLCHMNSRERQKALEWIASEYGFTGGWYYAYGQIGCLWDSPAYGPYESCEAAIEAARNLAND